MSEHPVWPPRRVFKVWEQAEAAAKACAVCGAPALYRVKRAGFCREHLKDANAALKRVSAESVGAGPAK